MLYSYSQQFPPLLQPLYFVANASTSTLGYRQVQTQYSQVQSGTVRYRQVQSQYSPNTVL